MHPNDAPLISDPIMQALLQMLKTNVDKASGVQEDALMAVGTLVEGRMIFQSVIGSLHVLPFTGSSLGHELLQICRALSSISLSSTE